MYKKASFYKSAESNKLDKSNELSENKTVACELCPHLCKIPVGKSGICTVRRNINGVLTAESYGKVTSIALDPIEKKPLYHFYPGSKILSIGSYGCNFKCAFCQNHSISMPQKLLSPRQSWHELSPEDIAAISKEYIAQGNIGAAYTYNEPLIGYEFVEDCARLIKKQGQKNVLVTNGFICREPLNRLLEFIDAVNIDVKSFNPSFYKEIGGALDDVKRTVENIKNIKTVKTDVSHPHQCHVEITALIIPQKNDSVEEMKLLSEWIADIDADIPLHISRFFPAYEMRGINPTPVETIYKLAEAARQNLRYVYHGNC